MARWRPCRALDHLRGMCLMVPRIPGSLLAAVVALSALAGPAPAQERDAFVTHLRKFADQHCVSCHGPEVQRSKLRLDTLPATFGDRDAAALWVKVLDRVSRGEMSPRTRPRPPEKE